MARKSTLFVLTIVVAALAAAVALDSRGPGGSAGPSTRLLPELERSALDRVTIRRDGEAPLELVRAADGALILAGSPSTVLDTTAVADLEGTLELLSYRRKLDGEAPGESDAARGLDPPRVSIELQLSDGQEVRLRVGDRIAAADQYWLRRSDRSSAFLVAGYAARALDRRAVDLRSRRPFHAHEHEVTGVELHAGGRSLVLGGQPMAVHLETAAGAVRADPGKVGELLGLIDALRIQRFAETPAGKPSRGGLTVRVVGARPPQELEVIGTCPDADDLDLAITAVGAGCVDRARLAAIAVYAGAESRLFDRRMIGDEEPNEISFSTSGKPWSLERRGRRWLFGSPEAAARAGADRADDGAVREWLRDVDRLATGKNAIRPPAGAPGEGLLGAVLLSYADGRHVRLVLRAVGRTELSIRRGEEPVVWTVGAEARSLFAVTPLQFRPRQLLSLEPYALREAREWRDGRLAEQVERGELLEEWRAVVPKGARVHLPAIAQLREAGSALRAVRFATAAPEPAQGLTPPQARVELVFDPPPAAGAGEAEPARHQIRLGRATEAGGCYARLDSDAAVFELPRAQCQALRGPWTLGQ